MSAKPAPNDPSIIRPGVRVVRRHPRAKRSTWGILLRDTDVGIWVPFRRRHTGAKSGFVDAWWLTRAGAVAAARALEIPVLDRGGAILQGMGSLLGGVCPGR